MIWLLVIVGVLLLLVGPLRRRVLAHWRIVVPLVVGGVLGLILVNKFMASSAPGWLFIVGPIFGGLIIGGACRDFLNEILDDRKRGS